MTIAQRQTLTIVSIWVGSNRILAGSLNVAHGTKPSGGSNLYPLVLNSWPISVYDNKRVTYFFGSGQTSLIGFTHKHAHTKNLFMPDGQNIGICVASAQTCTVRHLADVILGQLVKLITDLTVKSYLCFNMNFPLHCSIYLLALQR